MIMEDLNYLYAVWPRVTMGQVIKKKFLEWLFLGTSSCGVHKGREGSQTWVKLGSSLET